jgi:hypothetical protein
VQAAAKDLLGSSKRWHSSRLQKIWDSAIDKPWTPGRQRDTVGTVDCCSPAHWYQPSIPLTHHNISLWIILGRHPTYNSGKCVWKSTFDTFGSGFVLLLLLVPLAVYCLCCCCLWYLWQWVCAAAVFVTFGSVLSVLLLSLVPLAVGLCCCCLCYLWQCIVCAAAVFALWAAAGRCSVE